MIILRLMLCAAVLIPSAAAQKGTVTLFDGKDLKHWTTSSGNWVIQDGVLYLKDRSDAQEHNDSYLWTKEQYGDFALELEYKTPPDRANSGVFLRTADKNDPVYTGIEIQVGNLNPDRPLGRGSVGGIYDIVTPKNPPHRAGDWNKYVITCKGSKITVMLNGRVTAEADLDQWTETGKNPDGSKNKFKQPMKNFARRGYVGLQDHGLPVWYRNIRIRRLD